MPAQLDNTVLDRFSAIKEVKMKSIIRAYQLADHLSCMEAFRSNVPDFFTEEEIADFERFLIGMESGTSTAHFYVVACDDRVIGCGGFGDRNGDGIYSLAWGFIHREMHRKGFGEKLLVYRLDQIKQLNPKFSILLDMTQFSFRFFEKHGFRTLKITNDYYTSGMHRYDMALEM
jgi:predicted GNAT family N-acyltransferase